MHWRNMAVQAIVPAALKVLNRRLLRSESPNVARGLDDQGLGNCSGTRTKNGKQRNSSTMYFVEDSDGWTPLDVAVMEGRVDIVKIFLEAFHYSVKKLKSEPHNRSSSHSDVINRKDCHILEEGSNTCSPSTCTDADAMDPIGSELQISTVMDINEGGIFFPDQGYGYINDEENDRTTQIFSNRIRREYARGILLLAATLLATLTFYVAACRVLFPISKLNNYHQLHQNSKSESTLAHFFIIFNSIGFTASVAIIIFLLREFPFKPWPQISVSSLFGSYICLIRAISPYQALPLFLLSVPCLAFAAAGKLYGLSNYCQPARRKSKQHIQL